MMIAILPIELHEDVRAGVTMVDTSALPWPGATFSEGASATPEHVHRSYGLLAETLQTEPGNIVGVRQVHGRAVAVAPSEPTNEADALITDRRGLVIGVKVADCLGVLIYDPVHHVIGAVHSGWRGTAQQVVAAAIRQMGDRWGSKPQDLFVGLSPSASGRNYEVGTDVHDVLTAWCRPVEGCPDRWLYDNQQAVVDQLTGVGVNPERIHRSDICTMEDARFHSHRRDRERAGRCFAFISLRPSGATESANP